MNIYGQFSTPFGLMAAALTPQGSLLRLVFLESLSRDKQPHSGEIRDDNACHEVARQVNRFFNRQQTYFDLPLAPIGSEFQLSVWQALLNIPFGETRTYGQIAQAIGKPKSARAVGRANATNPISLIIPCHRVIGANGNLVGYEGGLPLKKRLLELEKSAIAQ